MRFLSNAGDRGAGTSLLVLGLLAFGPAASALDLAGSPRVAGADLALRCGAPVRQNLRVGATHSFRFSAPPETAVVVQATDVSGNIGLMRLRVSDGDRVSDTCTGAIRFVTRSRDTQIEISDCFGTDAGEYTLTAQVVSEGAANCARPLACGATPDGVGLALAGEVDAFSFAGRAGRAVGFLLTDLGGTIGGLRMRLFDPQGMPVNRGESCAQGVRVELPSSGLYTLLVGSCGAPRRGQYRVGFHDASCPIGPQITHFGVGSEDGIPVQPIGFDAEGRPIFFRALPDKMWVVVEARPGASGEPVAITTVDDGRAGLRVIASRPLGDGVEPVCEDDSLSAPERTASRDPDAVQLEAKDEVSCRFVDRDGKANGVEPEDACTRRSRNAESAYVDPTSTIQYCGPVTDDWALPYGDTIFTAMTRDEAGNTSAPREIVVRIGTLVGPSSTPTVTTTWTATSTRTSTPSRTATRSATLTQTKVATATRTRTPTLSPSLTPTRSATPTLSATPTSTTSPTNTTPPTATHTPTNTTPPTATPTPNSTTTPTATLGLIACDGDCDGDGHIAVHELTTAVNIALGDTSLADCVSADADGDGTVSVAEIVAAVQRALLGCAIAA